LFPVEDWMMPPKNRNLIELRDVSKEFDGIVALKGVNLSIRSNEIVGLVGDNGAGKTTLVKVLTGVYPPNKGEIYIKGKKIDNLTPHKARKLGIEVVHQQRAVALHQPIWKNIFMGREVVNFLGFLNVNKQKEETERLMKGVLRFRSEAVTPDTLVKTLSGGERQGVQVARALYFDADLVILDEPTTALSITEVDKVLDYVRSLKREGKSCLFISHNLSHVYSISDRIVIMDRGAMVKEFRKKDISERALFDQMKTVVKAGS
jgi:simple sugar transport system ATP-binding protein